MIHDVRDKWRIKSNCPCRRHKSEFVNKNGVTTQQLLNAFIGQQAENSPSGKVNGVSGDVYNKHSSMNGSPNSALNPLSFLADVATGIGGGDGNIDSKKLNLDGKNLNKFKEVLQEQLQNTGQFGKVFFQLKRPSPQPSNCCSLMETLFDTKPVVNVINFFPTI